MKAEALLPQGIVTRIQGWRDYLRKTTSADTEENAFIHASQVDLLHRGFAPGAVGTLLVALIFVLSMWEVASHQVLLGWLACMHGVVAIRAYISTQYHKIEEMNALEVRRWERQFSFGGALGGASWGALAPLFIEVNNSTALSMVILTISGVSAAGGALLASSPRAVVSFLLPTLLPLSIALFSLGDRFHLFMGAAVIIYLTVLLTAVGRRQTLMLQSIQTGIENERLKGTIAAEKMLANEREKTAAHIAKLETELQYQEIFENITDGLLLLDLSDTHEFKVVGANPAFLRMMELMPDTCESGSHIPISPKVWNEVIPHFRQCFESGKPVHSEIVLTMSGGTRVLDSVIIPVRNTGGGVVRLVGIARDITERKHMETLLFEREQAFRHLVQNSPDVIMRYDTQCRRIFSNAAYTRIFNRVASLGKTPVEDWGLPAESGQDITFQNKLQQILINQQPEEWELGWTTAEGVTICFMVRGVPEFDPENNVVSVLTFARDISERVRLEQEMSRQASYDALTGLPNRRMFNDRLREEFVKATRTDTQLALLFIDLDRFKEINDTLGHEAGDKLLKEAAQRIQSCLRESDTVARLGGDEFIAIISDLPDLTALGRVADQLLEAIMSPFVFNGKAAYVSASIGIAGYPLDADSPDELLACADYAMYAAKGKGKNTFSFFTHSMQKTAQHRVQLSHDLRSALSEGQLEVHYQPIINVASGMVVKAEALLRWKHPQHGWIPPDEFIPVAEENGFIHEIGAWVFRQAVIMVLDWKWQVKKAGNNISPCQVSVNISPRQFSQDKFDEAWLTYLAAMEVDPGSVVIEITEGLLLNDHHDVISKLRNFHDAGIKIALDDFGTGYSAMGYLKKFNIDYLKIDRSFVRDLHSDPHDRAIAEAIIAMSRRLGLKTIAEGVETPEQQEVLAEVGCEFVQGYLYARPMPAEDFLNLVREDSARAAERSDLN